MPNGRAPVECNVRPDETRTSGYLALLMADYLNSESALQVTGLPSLLVVPPRSKVEPQRVDVAVGRAKQVVLLDHIAIDEGIAERVAHCRRDARQQLGAVLVVPPRGEVEPQRVDVTVGGAKQVVLLKQAAFFVDEGKISKCQINCF